MLDIDLNCQISAYCSDSVGCIECGHSGPWLDEDKSTGKTMYFECKQCGEKWTEPDGTEGSE